MAVSGLSNILKAMGVTSAALERAAGAGLYAAASRAMTTTKTGLVPVDQGALTGSGYVTLPVTEGAIVSIESGFGGPAADYAAIQHEDQTLSHEVGTHKFFEKGIQQDAGEMPRIMAKYAEAALASGSASAPPSLHPDTPWSTHAAKQAKKAKATARRRAKGIASSKAKIRAFRSG